MEPVSGKVPRRVRLVYWMHRQWADKAKKVTKEQTPLDCKLTHAEAAEIIFRQFGYPPTTCRPSDGGRNFAEVISSTITTVDRETGKVFEAPRHLGTDCLFDPRVHAELQTKAPSKKRKPRKIE